MIILAQFIELKKETKLQSFDWRYPLLIWPYLSLFITHLTDFLQFHGI